MADSSHHCCRGSGNREEERGEEKEVAQSRYRELFLGGLSKRHQCNGLKRNLIWNNGTDALSAAGIRTQ